LTPFPEEKGDLMNSRIKRTQRGYTLTFELSVIEQVEKAN